ncbi:YicC family protein [Leptobacterium flavescens]|uniref:YicC family protein n=1 Tax=Leptobacterium flavescens TaxID=472055 RepID=A0A6P0UMF0_9FLAO|nr:YicC/YloC family endoribonuclease [Leptobacterium flavescens]NER14414.1 YicC family protein [Leptobacterium flavescens]
MIKSMTGFGKNVIQLPTKKITVELKSLNSKNLDLNARIPSIYREKELELRNMIAKSLVRGKIDFGLYIEITGEETSTRVNEGVVNEYIKQLKGLSLPGVGSDQDVELLKMAVRMPDALKTERDEIDEKEYKAIKEAVKDALEEINKFRGSEGKALESDFTLRVNNITALLEEVKKIDPERMDQIRVRLEKAVSEIKENVDANRFEQELIYYLEKFDITEEKVRLANHLEYFITTLSSKESNGKKLGFISQEMGREINTMGSKANYAPMQQVVVQMKDELEKIKEQLLNVL